MEWTLVLLAVGAALFVDHWFTTAVRAVMLDRARRDRNYHDAKTLYGLVVRHHSIGVMDDHHIGDDCPVCSRSDVNLIEVGARLIG